MASPRPHSEPRPIPAGLSGPDATAVTESFEILRRQGVTYSVVDAITDRDLETIGAAAAGHPLITGGSGVALGLPENFRRAGLLTGTAEAGIPAVEGRAVVLAGSCSEATRAQIALARQRWPSWKLDADRIAAGDPEVDEVLAWAAHQDERIPILIFGSADPDEVRATQARYGRERAGAMIEDAIGRIARALVQRGARRLVLAGGETSGAVVSALRVRGLRIGAEIAPGVPWTESVDEPHLALTLKSGNFGGENFFAEALDMLP